MEEKPIYTKPFEFIHKAGLELEGGWENPPSFDIAGDGSVRCDGNVLGEARTTPKDTMKGVFSEISTKYPDDIDASCGMHIHISIRNNAEYLLADQKFRDYFLYRMGILSKYLRNAGHKVDYERFIYRFGDKNQYCRREFAPGKQLRGGNQRRTMLNFCAYRNHKTIECRLLPMFEKISNAKMAAFEVIDTFEQYLKNVSKEELVFEHVVDVHSHNLIGENVTMEVLCV